MNHTVSATRAASQQMDGSAAARRALDSLRADFSNLVAGDDSTIFFRWNNNQPELAFTVRGRGPAGGGPSRFLAVSYTLDPTVGVIRRYEPVGWASTNLFESSVTAAVPSVNGGSNVVANGVLALSISVELDNGLREHLTNALPLAVSTWQASGTNTYLGMNVPSGWSALKLGQRVPLANSPQVRGLAVSVVALDGKNLGLVQPETLAAQFTAVLPQLATNQLPAEFWRTQLSREPFSSLPKPVLRALRVEQNVLPLP